METLWAEPVGRDRYRLQNVPFHAFGLSFDDVVLAKAADGQLLVEKVVGPGGHSTYRLILKPGINVGDAVFSRLWKPLEAIGATFEQANEHLLAVDIPETTDVYGAYALLQVGEAAGAWDFQEGHFGHALKK
jgi:hypothetical protein